MEILQDTDLKLSVTPDIFQVTLLGRRFYLFVELVLVDYNQFQILRNKWKYGKGGNKNNKFNLDLEIFYSMTRTSIHT